MYTHRATEEALADRYTVEWELGQGGMGMVCSSTTCRTRARLLVALSVPGSVNKGSELRTD